MPFSLQGIRHRYEVKASSYGLIVDEKGQHSIVLTDKIGNVVLKTDSFPRQERLIQSLNLLKQIITDPLAYFFQTHPDGRCYFSIRSNNSNYVAFSDNFANRQKADSIVTEIMKIGQDAPVLYFHKVKPPEDDTLRTSAHKDGK